MATYYDLIGISHTATSADIEAAIDTRYNKYRRLVTHHDTDVADKATQAMRQLEKIRATLLDPTEREAYDDSLQIGGVIGGLFDPASVASTTAPALVPSPPSRRSSPPEMAEGPALWKCPKCNANNPEHTTFCFKCGTELVRTCPACNKNTSLVITGLCGSCGWNYSAARQVATLSTRAQQLRDSISDLAATRRSLGETTRQGGLMALLSLVLIFYGWGIASGLMMLIITLPITYLLASRGIVPPFNLMEDARWMTFFITVGILSMIFNAWVFRSSIQRQARTRAKKIEVQQQNIDAELQPKRTQLNAITFQIQEIQAHRSESIDQ